MDTYHHHIHITHTYLMYCVFFGCFVFGLEHVWLMIGEKNDNSFRFNWFHWFVCLGDSDQLGISNLLINFSNNNNVFFPKKIKSIFAMCVFGWWLPYEFFVFPHWWSSCLVDGGCCIMNFRLSSMSFNVFSMWRYSVGLCLLLCVICREKYFSPNHHHHCFLFFFCCSSSSLLLIISVNFLRISS